MGGIRNGLLVLTASLVLATGVAQGGVLNGNPQAAISGTTNMSGTGVSLDLDYAVFSPGTYPGTATSKLTEFVYAYQAFVAANSNALLFLSVGAGPNFAISGAHNEGTDPGYGSGVAPTFQVLDLVGTMTFRNTFVSTVPAGQNSVILLFTSPNSWESGGAAATFGGGHSVNVQGIPSPSSTIPEPASLGLMGLALAALVGRRRA